RAAADVAWRRPVRVVARRPRLAPPGRQRRHPRPDVPALRPGHPAPRPPLRGRWHDRLLLLRRHAPHHPPARTRRLLAIAAGRRAWPPARRVPLPPPRSPHPAPPLQLGTGRRTGRSRRRPRPVRTPRAQRRAHPVAAPGTHPRPGPRVPAAAQEGRLTPLL